MTVPTAKAFRQQVLKPADGVFLFHARAIERLIEAQLGTRLLGVSVPDLPYYLMPRADFLLGLETENAEALSVIEGLRLPRYVILLPSPPQLRLERRGLRRLQLDYWARAFEAEVARSWQDGRDHDRAYERFGARGLRDLIGAQGFAEVRDVLDRDGVTLPIWEDDLVCRSFAAMVVRLRYFAPGARGFFFPAARVWSQIDDWLIASGLDLPRPAEGKRLPGLLVRCRPGNAQLPSDPPLLPTGLPFGDSDPDLAQTEPKARRDRLARRLPDPSRSASTVTAGTGQELEQACLAALQRGAQRQLGGRVGQGSTAGLRAWLRRRLADALLSTRSAKADHAKRRAGPRNLALTALEEQMALARRSEDNDRFAVTLRALAAARRLVRGLLHPEADLPPPIEQFIAEQEGRAEAQMAASLAAKWKLSDGTAAGLRDLIARLAADDRRPSGSAAARAILRHLDQVLAERDSDYYRLRIGHWLLQPSRQALREILPFQSLLKSLRALDASRQQLEALPWALADLERFSAILGALTNSVTDRLEAQINPRLELAMREADFVPRNHRETVAAQKMRLELLDVIKRRRHLKFTDVRDIVARNILRLPDPTLRELVSGDRLARFDRTASRALPGVYRSGAFYIKGLQQLGAPLFGTDPGRWILSHLLLPFGSAFLVLKTLDLLVALVAHDEQAVQLATPTTVFLSGALVNLVVHSRVGRRLAAAFWAGTRALLRFLLFDGLRQLLRWGPMARLMKTGLVRALWGSLIHPLLIGTLPLLPVIALATLIDAVPVEPGLWLAGIAFALGTLARNTPAGRRFLDDLSTDVGLYLRRLNQTLLIGLIQRLLYFFKETMRRLAQWLNRVDEALTLQVGERPHRLLLKVTLAPMWRFAETLIEFYLTVLVEPQVNPVKHFPIVTIGHKLMLPFLPAITVALVDITGAVLPKFISYPFVTLTIALLPGLFGFLVWELKEDWRLYQANHRRGTPEDAAGVGAEIGVEPAIVGAHGETMAGLMMRGFHRGTLPKGFDRLRQVIGEEIREQLPYPSRLRRAQRHLEEVQYAMCVFFERELTFALREHRYDPECALQHVETGRPRIATHLVELQADLYLGPNEAPPSRPAPVADLARHDHLKLRVSISQQGTGIRVAAELQGASAHLSRDCWSRVLEDLRVFAGRAGAPMCQIDIAVPAATPRPHRAAALVPC